MHSIKSLRKQLKLFGFENYKIILQEYKRACNKLRYGKYKGFYTFNKPGKGDITIINNNHINFRTKPTLKNKVIQQLSVGHLVKVLSVGKQQRISPWGKHYWYKVETYVGEKKGWVFGAFLEPVEVKVK